MSEFINENVNKTDSIIETNTTKKKKPKKIKTYHNKKKPQKNPRWKKTKNHTDNHRKLNTKNT